MPGAGDHTILNRARAILLRRWIDTRPLALGSVNGVVYVRGRLRRNPLFPAQRGAGRDERELVHALERDLTAIEGVKDVILELEGFERRGDHWERVTSPIEKTAA
jgi:hypothetical protein